MTETARGDGAALEFDPVTATGTVLAGLSMAGMLVPLRRGVTDPVVYAAVALSLLSFAVFLGRRHGALGRRIGAPIAALACLAVVLLSGYALNQGVTGSVPIPAVSTSASLVFLAFLAAGGAVGVGVADYFAVPGDGLKRRALLTGRLSVLGGVGLLAAYLWTFAFAVPLIVAFGDLSQTQAVAVSQLGMAFGTATVAIAFFKLRDLDRSFLDVRVPTLREVGWILLGTVAIFGTLIAISAVMSSTGVESSSHGTTERAQENPEILLVLIPAAILIIGPFEELLYRNVIQKTMYEVFSRPGAVVVGSVVFAAVHALAYGTAGFGAVIASLGVVFGLSLVLGTIYERTENLVVPALVHGVYNAIVFSSLYFNYA